MYQAPRGTQDLLPEEASTYWARVERECRRQAYLAGYQELRTPTFEATEVFARGVGSATDIVEKEMYTFQDKGGDSLTLRPEGTAAVMRAYFEHGMASRPQPVKLFSLLNLFRYDRPQKGRLREFHQFNVEAIGEGDPAVDAELVALQVRLYAELGLKDLRLLVNSVGDPSCRPGYVETLRDYFAGHRSSLCEDCNRRLETNPLRLLDDKTPECQPVLNGAPRSVDHLCQPCLEHFQAWTSYLQAAATSYEVHHRLVRGLDYYTRSVWEVLPPGGGSQSTIGGGGRYDGLSQQLDGRPTPGVGFATGIERIILTLKEQAVQSPAAAPLDAYFVYQTSEAKRLAFTLAERLRDQGLAVGMAFGDRKLDKQLKAADRSGARYAVVLGEAELAAGEVSLKDLRNGQEQRRVPTGELTQALGGATWAG